MERTSDPVFDHLCYSHECALAEDHAYALAKLATLDDVEEAARRMTREELETLAIESFLAAADWHVPAPMWGLLDGMPEPSSATLRRSFERLRDETFEVALDRIRGAE